MFRFFTSRFEELLGAALLGIMAAVAFVNVIVRYCTTYSFAWSEELTINFFVWVVLLGAAREFRDGGHLCMSLLYTSLSRPWRFCCYWLGVICCCVFFGVMIWMGTLEVLDEMALDASSESLGLPVWWYTVATPLFSALAIVRLAQRAAADMRRNDI